MKILKGPNYDDASLYSYAMAKTRKKGLLRRESLEYYTIGKKTMRVFRFIHFFNNEGQPISTSLIDDECASISMDFEERLLLWRPRYVNLAQEEMPFEFPKEKASDEKVKSVQVAVEELIKERKTAQEQLAELQPKITKIHEGWRSTASLFLPRSPSSIMKDEDIAKMKRSKDAVVRASSLVIGCPDTASVESATIGDSILVATTLIKFSSIDDNSMRILVLENPSAQDLEDALSKGRALTRLIEINEKCRHIIVSDVFESNSA
jgi:hypothetical protein